MSRPTTSAPIDRRRFLGAVGALALVPLAAGCGGGDVTAASCEGYDALTEQDLQTRAALNYVDDSPNPSQFCTNCRLFNRPAGGSECGGCQLFAGPVAPGGWCSSWSPTA